MPQSQRLFAGLLATVTFSCPLAAFAADPTDVPRVYGGEEVPDCHWPTTVAMGASAGCTGTLIHPQIVVYAGHCGTDRTEIRIASTIEDPEQTLVPTEYCRTHPKWTGSLGLGRDFAYCKLAEPVEDVPIIPPLMGCELEALAPGEMVWAIGFGYDETRDFGIKHAVEIPILELDLDNEVLVGEEWSASICHGDSGGPLAIQLPESIDPERGWRVFGVTSWGSGNCWRPQYFGLMHNAIPWIEKDAGIDVTPCHDADGTWRGGPECQGFPLDPVGGTGTWENGCTYPDEVTGVVTTCGPAAADVDDTPPHVSIASPPNGLRGEVDDDGKFAVDVLGEATDEGWGVAQVSLRINDEHIEGSEQLAPPYTWPLNLPEGQYIIYLDAVDEAGNEASSLPLLLGVGMDPPAPPDGDDDDDDDNDDADAGDDAAGETDDLDDPMATETGDEGCACAASPPSDPRQGMAALALLLWAGIARRRARASRRDG